MCTSTTTESRPITPQCGCRGACLAAAAGTRITWWCTTLTAGPLASARCPAARATTAAASGSPLARWWAASGARATGPLSTGKATSTAGSGGATTGSAPSAAATSTILAFRTPGSSQPRPMWLSRPFSTASISRPMTSISSSTASSPCVPSPRASSSAAGVSVAMTWIPTRTRASPLRSPSPLASSPCSLRSSPRSPAPYTSSTPCTETGTRAIGTLSANRTTMER
mmetsp:Transcript_15660/g.42044  ORF Transcript_15660/g.42044 Transcript_15660/m.42044 type:complete len:226 (-) Transcript_15660:572-1249(-)